jgi:hypothetical protein
VDQSRRIRPRLRAGGSACDDAVSIGVLSELAKVITQHPSFQQPSSPSISIWRYMDLTKFLWMIQRSALYFCRADLLGDPFEAHYTRAQLAWEAQIVEELKRHGGIPDDLAQQAASSFRRMTLDFKQSFFVNCWHMNDSESLAMWKLYTSHHQSVCIRSNYASLTELLPTECMAGCVKYIDYNTDVIEIGNALNVINHKRLSFEHEKELRAVIWNTDFDFADGVARLKQPLAAGRIVPIDIGRLISEVFVSPDSEEVLFEVVRSVCERYGLHVPVTKSEANAPPAY